MMDETRLETLIDRVQANQKYRHIARDLVRRLSQEAITKGLSGKAAVKDVRNKLHQVGGAYFKGNPDYVAAQKTLSNLSDDSHSEEIKQFCIRQMQSHSSTAERLPILETFFHTCLEPIAPVTSVLDLACGLNPLAIPWMPLANEFEYYSCDIYLDMLAMLDTFYNHFGINGTIEPCDLIGTVPDKQTQVAFLLKSITCLEQVDKNIGPCLLEGIRADHILVSFPVRSLRGRKKGMPDFYRKHFYDMVSDKNWGIREFLFSTELAFLVTK